MFVFGFVSCSYLFVLIECYAGCQLPGPADHLKQRRPLWVCCLWRAAAEGGLLGPGKGQLMAIFRNINSKDLGTWKQVGGWDWPAWVYRKQNHIQKARVQPVCHEGPVGAAKGSQVPWGCLWWGFQHQLSQNPSRQMWAPKAGGVGTMSCRTAWATKLQVLESCWQAVTALSLRAVTPNTLCSDPCSTESPWEPGQWAGESLEEHVCECQTRSLLFQWCAGE